MNEPLTEVAAEPSSFEDTVEEGQFQQQAGSRHDPVNAGPYRHRLVI